MADPNMAQFLQRHENLFMERCESRMKTTDFADLFNHEVKLESPAYESLWQKDNIKMWLKQDGSQFESTIPLVANELHFDPKYTLEHVI